MVDGVLVGRAAYRQALEYATMTNNAKDGQPVQSESRDSRARVRAVMYQLISFGPTALACPRLASPAVLAVPCCVLSLSD